MPNYLFAGIQVHQTKHITNQLFVEVILALSLISGQSDPLVQFPDLQQALWWFQLKGEGRVSIISRLASSPPSLSSEEEGFPWHPFPCITSLESWRAFSSRNSWMSGTRCFSHWAASWMTLCALLSTSTWRKKQGVGIHSPTKLSSHPDICCIMSSSIYSGAGKITEICCLSACTKALLPPQFMGKG